MERDISELRIWRIIGLRVGQRAQCNERYALLLEQPDDEDIVLTCEGDILLFDNFQKAKQIALNYGTDLGADEFELGEVFYCCNIRLALELVLNGLYDEDSAIINTLLPLIDFVKASRVEFPQSLRKPLYEAADFFTFSKDISEFFSADNSARQRLYNALLWATGVLCANSKIVGE